MDSNAKWSSREMKAHGRAALQAAVQLGDAATLAFLVERFAALNAGRAALRDFGARNVSRYPDPTETDAVVAMLLTRGGSAAASPADAMQTDDPQDTDDRTFTPAASDSTTAALADDEDVDEAAEQALLAPPEGAFAGSSSEDSDSEDDDDAAAPRRPAAEAVSEFVSYADVTEADFTGVRNSHKSRPFRGNAKGDAPVHVAAQNDFATLLRELLTNSASRYIRNAFGHTPLHLAAQFGAEASLAELLLLLPYLANFRDHVGRTALHLAAAAGTAGAVRCLLGHPGVNRRVRDRAGRTCLDVAHPAVRGLIEHDLRENAAVAPTHRLDYDCSRRPPFAAAGAGIWHRCPVTGFTVFHRFAETGDADGLAALLADPPVSLATLQALMCVVDVDYRTPYEVAAAKPELAHMLQLLVPPAEAQQFVKRDVNGNVPATLRSKHPDLRAFIYAPEVKEPKPRNAQVDTGLLDEWAGTLAALPNSKYLGQSAAAFGACYRDAVKVAREDRHTVTDVNIQNSLQRNEAGTQATCELHGAGSRRLQGTLTTFLEQAVARGLTRVNVITGKGNHGGGGSVRSQTPHILNASPLVAGYELAKNHSAFYVNLTPAP